MNTQLMVHVERIVRPILGRESVKLRLRREVYAHLLSAYDEEHSQGNDESSAIALAIARLGNTDELRHQMQTSIPRLQQIFLTDFPMNSALRRLEQSFSRASDRVTPGINALNFWPMTHAMLFVMPMCIGATATPVLRAVFTATHFVLPTDVGISHARMLIGLTMALLMMLLPFTCVRFLIAIVGSGKTPQLQRAAASLSVAVLAQVLLTGMLSFAIRGHWPELGSVVADVSVLVAVVTLLVPPARWIAQRAQPYEAWLRLEVD